MSTIIIITPPPKKDPAAPETAAVVSDYDAAIGLLEEAESVGSVVRIVHAD